jgi:hypothetical protein
MISDFADDDDTLSVPFRPRAQHAMPRDTMPTDGFMPPRWRNGAGMFYLQIVSPTLYPLYWPFSAHRTTEASNAILNISHRFLLYKSCCR